MSRDKPEDGMSSLESQLLESGVPEGADCILTEKQFRGRYGAILASSSEEEEEI